MKLNPLSLYRQRMKAKNQRMKRMRDFKPQWVPSGQFAPQPLGRGAAVAPVQNARMEAFQMRRQGKLSCVRFVIPYL